MKKIIVLIFTLVYVLSFTGCGNESEDLNSVIEQNNTESEVETEEDTVLFADENQSIVSGSFTVGVRDVIPDYCLDDFTPNVAVVTEFQSYPFTLYVGEEIGRQLEIGQVYVFTIEPIIVDFPKEYLEKLELSSLVWDLPGFKITDFRLANDDELGLESLRLTIE